MLTGVMGPDIRIGKTKRRVEQFYALSISRACMLFLFLSTSYKTDLYNANLPGIQATFEAPIVALSKLPGPIFGRSPVPPPLPLLKPLFPLPRPKPPKPLVPSQPTWYFPVHGHIFSIAPPTWYGLSGYTWSPLAFESAKACSHNSSFLVPTSDSNPSGIK